MVRSSSLYVHSCNPRGGKDASNLLARSEIPNSANAENVVLNCCLRVASSCFTRSSSSLVTNAFLVVVVSGSVKNSSTISLRLSTVSKIK